jgi:cell division septum initiation protein DivIVA
MRKIFKRAFLGYDPANVRKKIRVIRYEYKNALEPFKEELRLLNDRNEELRAEINEIKEKLLNSKEIELKIKEALYDAHIEACRKMYDIEIKNDQIVNEKK